ncbi:hypothetical protein L2728_06365 [Shewanella chilikensis]|jgi:hypothetical protein|uniref:hypothetical protein n=1 Tax=Shewanella chilikensis TaxID=558541 RepID=UPI00200DD1DA|nr:hypothetical protein [Shewanella chilikensis]MCL1161511.1 hypothetical protein [Shewanella chilikensis]
MAYGIASYVNGKETVNVAEPLAIFYVVRINNLRNGTLTFTLPNEASLTDVIPFIGPSSRTPDRVFDFGGSGGIGAIITNISIVNRVVSITFSESTGPVSAPTSHLVSFFNSKGLPCTASN